MVSGLTLATGLSALRDTYEHLASLGFNVVPTPITTDEAQVADNPVSGRGIVFSGKMVQGVRSEMQALARNLGAKVQTSVSGATDILVCGAKVGSKKLEKARSLGVQIISEDEFLSLIGHK